jgi:ATP phosphoribosyltransferase regulatory subunit
MEKMGRRVGAIGFAVYLDLLDRLDRKEKQYDADMVLLYDEDADAGELMRAVDLLTGSGKRVIAEKAIPTGIRYRQLLSFRNGGLEILETND